MASPGDRVHKSPRVVQHQEHSTLGSPQGAPHGVVQALCCVRCVAHPGPISVAQLVFDVTARGFIDLAGAIESGTLVLRNVMLRMGLGWLMLSFPQPLGSSSGVAGPSSSLQTGKSHLPSGIFV